MCKKPNLHYNRAPKSGWNLYIVIIIIYSSFDHRLSYTVGGLYSGTPLNRTPLGQSKMSLIERCPHFRGC